MTQHTQDGPTFDGLGIAPNILEVLAHARFTTPTPIQQKAIPIALDGKDVVGIAQTGTGKTLAFAIPIIQRLAQLGGRALVVLPTRELAVQVEETIARLGRNLGVRSVVLMGGISMSGQISRLRQNPQVIIATPGRLLDHMQQRTVTLNEVRTLVLDEADRMFDMGFAPAIQKIMAALPQQRQTMLFSATMPPEIMKLAARYMGLPVRVEVVQQGTTSDRVSQEIIFVKKEDKARLLEKVLDEVKGSVLVFSRTKHGARKLTRALRTAGVSAAEIHSDRSLGQRREALEGFKSGKFRVLVATDIAARGIDVKGIELVVNFDLPDAAEDYVHRIGRTGRAGREGRAMSFATPDQKSDVVSIERLIRMRLPVSQHGELPPARAAVHDDSDRERTPYQGRSQRPAGGGGSYGGQRREFAGGGDRREGGFSRGPRGPRHQPNNATGANGFHNRPMVERPAPPRAVSAADAAITGGTPTADMSGRGTFVPRPKNQRFGTGGRPQNRGYGSGAGTGPHRRKRIIM